MYLFAPIERATHFDASRCLFLDGWYKYANFDCRYRRYCDIISLPTVSIYTSTISDQTDRTGTLARYDGAGPSEYLSDSDTYNNDSDCGSDDYNNYESNYESDNERALCVSTSTTEAVKERKGILSSSPRDMSNDKGSLDCLPIYSFLFLNEKGSSLYNAYDRDEVEDKLVIKIDQDDRAPKFSVADDISEVYGLPGIHECINGQKPLRAVIDIDASQEDMEVTVTTSTDPSKCSYHILYAPALLIDHHELKAFTELVYTISGEKFGKYIDRGLPDNGWNELDHVRVQPPPSLGLEVRPWMLSEKKNNNPLRIIVSQDVLQKCANLVLQKHSNYLRDWTIEEKDLKNFVYFNRKGLLECPLCKRIHDKDQRWFGRVYASNGTFIVKCFRQGTDEPREVFECESSIAEKIQQENKNSPQSSHKVKASGFLKAFVKMPSWVKYIDPLTATETYVERYVRSLPNKGDICVGSPWETGKTYVLENLVIPDDVNLLVLSTRHSYSNAVTTRLNLRSYFDIDGNINLPDHKRVVCQIESLHRIVNKCKCNKKCKCSPIQYDLWLDEIVSIIAQAQSRLAGQSIERLYKLIQEARRIIVMDNDLTDLNIEWIKPLRKDKPFSVIHNTYQPQNGKTFRLAPNKETVLAELWDWARQMSLLPFENRTSVSLICHLRKDVQGIVRALKTDFPELRIKEYHSKSDPVEKAHDFSNVEESWKDLYRNECWDESDVILHAMYQRLYMSYRTKINRGIFPDIDSIIRNKDVPTIRLWVAFMLEKFRSQRLFGWKMVDFLRKAGMIISIIEPIPKYDENVTSLSQVVKLNSATIKAEEISAITNANILDHETAELLESKSKKTLEEIRSLDRHHIADCYEISSESLTEEFISKEDRLTTITQAERHRICLELLKICTPARDIDDRARYKSDVVKMCLNSPESISHLQDLVLKMARVFDNTDASRRVKKSGLKTDRAKLGLLNSALHATYGLKFKAVDRSEEIYWENGQDARYGYSKLPPDELIDNFTISSKVDNMQITEDIQDLFDIC
uniref:Replication origin-binding protein domain-containing protein n=1 Tax=Rhizophagus irregularis (strain DAOM 181602 / DAOM 197198 / MUCL 43194) TaxID=747089 RepID=U9TCS9_RHIID